MATALLLNDSTRSRIPAPDHDTTINITDSPVPKMTEDNFQQSTEYHSYINHEPNESLLKKYVLWFLNNALLALFTSLLQPLLLVLFIICIQWIFQLLRWPYIIGLILAIILPSLYYFHWIYYSLSSVSYHIDALYTVIPLYLSIVFKDAIFVASHLRYNVRRQQKEDYAELKNSCCPPWKDTLIKYLDKFITDYRIWGTTLKHFTPYGEFILSRPHRQEKKSAELFPITHADGGKINFQEYYSNSDQYLRYIMRISSILLAIIPTVFFFIYHSKHKEFHYSGVLAAIGMVFLLMVSWSINEFIEIIFYQLSKYYRYMFKLTSLIELVPDQCNHLHAVGDEESSEISRFSQRTPHRKTAEDKSKQNPVMEPRILLFDGKGNNSFIWFENWSRVERIACEYFAKRQSIVFALFTTLFACIVCILYYYIHQDVYNTITVSIAGGFLYSSMVLIRLLLFALKISSLESRQIEFIRLQQTYLKHRILNNNQFPEAMELKEEKSERCGDYNLDNAIVSYLDDVVMHIEFRSLSPKIAGVKLDTALVRMTISSFAGFITGLVTYLLSHLKIE